MWEICSLKKINIFGMFVTVFPLFYAQEQSRSFAKKTNKQFARKTDERIPNPVIFTSFTEQKMSTFAHQNELNAKII